MRAVVFVVFGVLCVDVCCCVLFWCVFVLSCLVLLLFVCGVVF